MGPEGQVSDGIQIINFKGGKGWEDETHESATSFRNKTNKNWGLSEVLLIIGRCHLLFVTVMNKSKLKKWKQKGIRDLISNATEMLLIIAVV